MPRLDHELESTAVDLDLLDLALNRFSHRTAQRGTGYAVQGRVGGLVVRHGVVEATVHGTVPYVTRWTCEDNEWWCECTCPIGVDCKHAYAVAICALQAAVEIERPPAPRPRRPPPPRRAPLDILRTSPSTFERGQALEHLCADRTGPPLPWLVMPHDVLAEDDPDIRCWRAAVAVRRQANGWLPVALEPFRERPDIAAKLTERERAALVQALSAWARTQRHSDRQLMVEVGLAVGHDGTVRPVATPLLTTARLAAAPRTVAQLRQLRSEVAERPGLLPPTTANLLMWLTDNNLGSDTALGMSQHSFGPGTLFDRLGPTDAGRWSRDLPADIALRGGIETGSPIRWAADPAQLLPALVAHAGMPRVELRFHWPDGRARAFSEVVHLADPHAWSRPRASAVVADGIVSPVVAEPPQPLVDRLQLAGGLDVPVAERPAMFGLLGAAFPHLRDTIATHTRFLPVAATVTLDLRDRDWLHFRAFVHTRDGRAFEYDPSSRWVELETPPGPAATNAIGPRPAASVLPPPVDVPDAWTDAPDPAVTEPLVKWIAAGPVAPGTHGRPGGHAVPFADAGLGWWARLGPRTVEAFADAWEGRPLHVTWLGTPAVRRLLDPTERVTPRLRIDASGVDWFAVSAQWEAEGLALTDKDMAALRGAPSRFVRLEGGWVRRDATAAVEGVASALGDLGIEVGDEPQRLSLWTLAGARRETLATLEGMGGDAETIAAVRTLRKRIATFKGLPKVRLPRDFKARLRPYQKGGFDFLAHASDLGIGTILADDMGLGKTVQALAWLAHLRAMDADGGPSLVVCPASVMGNWMREASRFAPGLRAVLLDRGAERHVLRARLSEYDLVVTNYTLLRHDADVWAGIALRALVLDEAQNLKNPDAAVTRVTQRLTARYRLALTGTPLENRALDLWSIMNVVNPGYLGSRAAFTTRFDRADTPPSRRALLAARLRPVMLRRLKREVATDLPDRIEERRDCDLTPGQRRLYLGELRRSQALVERFAGEPGGLARRRIDVLAALTRLRQICCHPALAGGRDAVGSGKFDAFFDLIEPLRAEGHKVLVFSQFVECLKLLAAELRRRAIGLHMLTGATTGREAVVDAFSADPDPNPFLVSLRAGGTGLNLTAASYVVLFDPWWNPAVEAQAIDRTHRIGQDRTVVAYRLIARGTVEEKIWDLQQRKAALVADVLGEGGFGRALTREDLEYLLQPD